MRKLKKCFEFSGDEYFFQGHFPEVKVLPGVMQLKMVRDFIEESLGGQINPKLIKRMKFMRVVRPGDKLELEIELADGECDYVFSTGGEKCSSGSFVF